MSDDDFSEDVDGEEEDLLSSGDGWDDDDDTEDLGD